MAEKKKETKIENSEEKKNKSHDKQVYIFLGIVAAILIILVLITLSQQLDSKFEYRGLKFNKYMEGGVVFYTTSLPIVDQLGNEIDRAYFDFRNDPRTLKTVATQNMESMWFAKNKTVFVSFAEGITPCEYNGVASSNLGMFLARVGFEVKSGINNASSSTNTTGFPYVNCETHSNNTVITIASGDKNEVSRIANFCYKIEFTNCEILKSTERFQLNLLEQLAAS